MIKEPNYTLGYRAGLLHSKEWALSQFLATVVKVPGIKGRTECQNTAFAAFQIMFIFKSHLGT